MIFKSPQLTTIIFEQHKRDPKFSPTSICSQHYYFIRTLHKLSNNLQDPFYRIGGDSSKYMTFFKSIFLKSIYFQFWRIKKKSEQMPIFGEDFLSYHRAQPRTGFYSLCHNRQLTLIPCSLPPWAFLPHHAKPRSYLSLSPFWNFCSSEQRGTTTEDSGGGRERKDVKFWRD